MSSKKIFKALIESEHHTRRCTTPANGILPWPHQFDDLPFVQFSEDVWSKVKSCPCGAMAIATYTAPDDDALVEIRVGRRGQRW